LNYSEEKKIKKTFECGQGILYNNSPFSGEFV